jgi:hypothetical protein
LRSADPNDPCLSPSPGRGHWELQNAKPCPRCTPIELQVSAILQSRFRFRCVAIFNGDERNDLERLLVATLAKCLLCKPSPKWLGLCAYSGAVRSSGLWNSQYINGSTMQDAHLRNFAEHVEKTPGSVAKL